MVKDRIIDLGGELGDYPNDKYRQFFEKFSEIKTLEVAEYKPLHILAFFCRKYQEHYGINYKFKFNSPAPSKCFEIFQVKKLGMLLSSDPHTLVEYIDWVFQNIVPQIKRRFTSISFLTKDETINPYKLLLLKGTPDNTETNRSTLLPENICQVFTANGMTINTYGSLAFLAKTERTEQINKIFAELKLQGFDETILETIK